MQEEKPNRQQLKQKIRKVRTELKTKRTNVHMQSLQKSLVQIEAARNQDNISKKSNQKKSMSKRKRFTSKSRIRKSLSKRRKVKSSEKLPQIANNQIQNIRRATRFQQFIEQIRRQYPMTYSFLAQIMAIAQRFVPRKILVVIIFLLALYNFDSVLGLLQTTLPNIIEKQAADAFINMLDQIKGWAFQKRPSNIDLFNKIQADESLRRLYCDIKKCQQGLLSLADFDFQSAFDIINKK